MNTFLAKVLSFAFVLCSVTSPALAASGTYGVGNGGDQLDWTSLDGCDPGNGTCRPTDQGTLASACIKNLIENHYSINFGNRFEICNSTASWEAIRTLQVLTSRGRAIHDALLLRVVSIADGQVEVRRCIETLASHDYFVNTDRAESCREFRSKFAMEALEILVKVNTDLSFPDTLRSVAMISNPFAVQCVNILAKGGHKYRAYTRRIVVCSTFNSPKQISLLKAVVTSQQPLPDDMFEGIARIR